MPVGPFVRGHEDSHVVAGPLHLLAHLAAEIGALVVAARMRVALDDLLSVLAPLEAVLDLVVVRLGTDHRLVAGRGPLPGAGAFALRRIFVFAIEKPSVRLVKITVVAPDDCLGRLARRARLGRFARLGGALAGITRPGSVGSDAGDDIQLCRSS